MKIVAEVLSKAVDVSAEAVLDGLPGITAFDTGFGPTINFSKPNPVAGFERVFNTQMLLWVVKDGKFSLVQDEPLEMQPAIEILGK